MAILDRTYLGICQGPARAHARTAGVEVPFHSFHPNAISVSKVSSAPARATVRSDLVSARLACIYEIAPLHMAEAESLLFARVLESLRSGDTSRF